MLGSGSEADDAVQETMVKAWKAVDRFEGRSSLRTWLFRIASNVCIDMNRSPQRRARPVDIGPSRTPDPVHLADVLPEDRWITPVADEQVIDVAGDPAQVAAARDTIRLAFIAALQRPPARQRAALVLCEVLAWSVARLVMDSPRDAADDVPVLTGSGGPGGLGSSVAEPVKVRVEAPDVEAYADGDLVAPLPVTVECLPSAGLVLVP